MMHSEIKQAREVVQKIVLFENDLVSCFKEETLTGHFTAHDVKIADLEYSEVDNAFCCPKHHTFLLRGAS